MKKKKEQKIGIVPRGTIVQLAKSMCRAKIVECESAIRRAKYSYEPSTWKPSDAPLSVRNDARKAASLKKLYRQLESRLVARGYSLDHNERLQEHHSVRRTRDDISRVTRQNRLNAARDLREQTLIALVGATSSAEAGMILKALRTKLDVI